MCPLPCATILLLEGRAHSGTFPMLLAKYRTAPFTESLCLLSSQAFAHSATTGLESCMFMEGMRFGSFAFQPENWRARRTVPGIVPSLEYFAAIRLRIAEATFSLPW